MESNRRICALAWTHLYVEADGGVKPCCVSSDRLRDERGRPLDLKTRSLERIWGSSAFETLRQSMLERGLPRSCTLCLEQEAKGWASFRLWANSRWLPELTGASGPEAALTVKGLERPRSFHISFGNACNLRCRTCNSVYSSSIGRDRTHLAWTSAYLPLAGRGRFGTNAPWYESSELAAEVAEFSLEARVIQLAGGEPLINRTQMAWLEELRRRGQAGDIQLVLWTNATRLNKRAVDLVCSFGDPRVNLSIDGHGELNAYIRHKARFRDVAARVRLLHGTRATVSVVPVLQMYNILTVTRLFDWARTQGFKVDVNTVNGAPHLDFRLLPKPARELAASRLEDWMRGLDPHDGHDAHLKTKLGAVLHDLAAPPLPGRDHLLRVFLRFTREMDQARGEDFGRTCPELAAFMEDWLAGR